MYAHAALSTELRHGPHGSHTQVTTLRSDPPLTLRHGVVHEPEPGIANTPGLARVTLAAAAAGPVGGDRYQLDVHVGAGSTLLLNEVSATLLLPGHDGAQSRTDVHIRIDAEATLVWLPKPVIAAHRCDHVNAIDVDLAGTARLLMREELLVGRYHEPSGRLRQQVRVRRAGQPLYRQDLHLGTRTTTTPAVIADHHAVGSVLVVDPTWESNPPEPQQLPGLAAVMPLAGAAAVLVSALADDNLELRRLLTAGLSALGPPWQLGISHPLTPPH